MRNIFLIASLLLALPLFAQNKTINAANSSVNFMITNAGLEVEGKFSEISGTVQFDASDLNSSKFTANVRVSSIDTEIEMRDDHLKSEDYFDVAKYPLMKFESTAISGKEGNYKVTGKLTIKDVTKTISFPFSTYSKDGSLHLKGTFEIDRRDYNVGGNSWIMGDDVTVTLDIASK
ncbi:MAG: YceI family protein [Bacteroidia bacterium]